METKAIIQYVKVTMVLPGPRNLAGSTSFDMSQQRAEIPDPEALMKMIRETMGSHPKLVALPLSCI